MWKVYILQCSDGTLYTGITNDLERRFWQHKNRTGAKYTQRKGAEKIIYTESHPDRSSASKREAEVKKLTRKQKLDLIKSATIKT